LKLGELAIYIYIYIYIGLYCVRKSLSKILKMLFRFEIGRKFKDTVGSRPGFFRSRVTEACLHLEGIVPREKDRVAK